MVRRTGNARGWVAGCVLAALCRLSAAPVAAEPDAYGMPNRLSRLTDLDLVMVPKAR